MSIQTTVLENGRWVVRNVDPYRVRAQNTETPRKEHSQRSVSLPKTPSLGILTKTLVRSPVINRIIPARIRHRTKNDVLFISANFVTIKEAKGDFTLAEVAVKHDFDSTIKSARILGEARRHTKHDDSYVMLKDNHWRYDIQEDEDADLVDEGDHLRELPPHILVLALESNRLVFMCAISGVSNSPELWSSQKALPAPTSPLQSLGEMIAIDPKSRAMAVAAHEERLYVYALKSMDEMRTEFKEKARLEPIKEEKFIVLDGSILKMEFLHPPKGESNRIILLLVVEKDSKSRLIWYDWDADIPLHQAQLRPNKTLLRPDERLPLLLIPLERNAAFILVCEKRIVLIKDILTGGFHRFFHSLAFEQEPEEPGSSLRPPLWVQWARPMRDKGYRPDQENIVLCREDGIVQYMVIDHNIKQMIDSNHNVGRLGVKINTSFATVDLGLNREDWLIAGGDESDGGGWAFPPRQRYADQRNVIPNWTPLNDSAVANSPIVGQNAGTAAAANNALKGEQRLFACSGRGKYGSISELRYGMGASKKFTSVALNNDLEKGVMGIWAFHGFYNRKVDEHDGQKEYLEDVTYIILSHPLRTYLLRLWLKQESKRDEKKKDKDKDGDDAGLLRPECDVIDHDVGLDFNVRSITAGHTIGGLTIQITEISLRATSLPVPSWQKETEVKEEDIEDEKPDKRKFDGKSFQVRYTYSFGSSRILAACIHTTEDNTIIVLAAQKNGHFYLEFGTFATEYQPLERRVPLQAQPSCLSLLQVENELVAIVGTLAGELEIYSPGDIGSGLLTFTTSIPHAFAGLVGICDSVASISRATLKGMQSLLVCGLRDGTVEILKLSKEVGTYRLAFCEKMAFGLTSVTVTKDITTNRAIVCCENTCCTLEYPQTNDEAPATVFNVWITDPNEPSLHQGSISALCQVVDSWYPGGRPGIAADSFVCIDGDQIHLMTLDSQPRMVPRRLELGGTPERVLYSVYLNKLVVLHNKMEVLRAVRGVRAFRPMMSFLDIDNEQEPNASQSFMVPDCKPHEKCLGITEWFPKVLDRSPYILVINTIINSTLNRAHKLAGRLLIFSATPEGTRGELKFNIKKTINTNEPVYCVATYPDASLVYCCGNNLYMLTVEAADPKPRFRLTNGPEIAMRSPARHISVKEPYIYVSSSRESLSVYRYDAGQLVYQFGDQYARCGLHHLQLPSRSLVLASDMAGTVVGLWQPPERRIDNAMTTVFEAALPGSVTRLRRISRPIWSHGRSELNESDLDRLHSLSSLEDEIILGSSADGTLTQMSILSSSEWRLLRFVQNMAERHPLVCPHHPRNPHKRHVEPSTARPQYLHINGDILERVLERGGEGLLNEMLDVEPDHESHTDFGSKEDRRKRFEELAKEVLKDVETAELVGRLVLWLRYQLQNAL